MIWILIGALIAALVLFCYAVYIKARVQPQTRDKLDASHSNDETK